MAEPPAATTATGIYCKQCGYDLRASAEAGRCPECGRAFSPGDPATFRPRPFAAERQRALGRWARRGAILLLVLLVLLAGRWGWRYWVWKQNMAMLAQARIDGVHLPGRWHRDPGGGWVREHESEVHTASSDADLLALRKLPWLENLDLRDTVTDQGLAGLREFPRLRRLTVFGTRVTDAGLDALPDLPRLEELVFYQTPLTDAGLVHLAKLPALQKLGLSLTKITDAGLVHLETLAALRELALVGTEVTDAGLVHLEKLPTLEHLDLRVTKVTPAGVTRLKAALPGCRIAGP